MVGTAFGELLMKSKIQTESTCPSDVDLWKYLDISSVRKFWSLSTQNVFGN